MAHYSVYTYQSARVIIVESIINSVRITTRALINFLTVIDVVQARMRVLMVIHHQRTPQPIAVLRRHMRVIPERSCLVSNPAHA